MWEENRAFLKNARHLGKDQFVGTYGADIHIDWTIWKTAEPITTKIKSANSSGDTGYCSSFLEVLLTFPRLVMFSALFSFAFRMRGVVAIVLYGINFTK